MYPHLVESDKHPQLLIPFFIFFLSLVYVVSNVALSKIGTAFPVNSSSSKPDTTGLEKADQKVHENTGSGLCQGDHPTEALGAEGCNNPFVTDPGNSDNHRQDK